MHRQEKISIFVILRKIEKELRRFKKRIFSLAVESKNGVPEPEDPFLFSDAQEKVKLHIDSPPLHSPEFPFITGLVSLKGWVIARQGIKKFRCSIDDQPIENFFFGFTRPDVAEAHPDYKDAAKSGFCIKIDTRLFEKGEHSLRFFIETEDKEISLECKILISGLDSQLWLENNKLLDQDRRRLLEMERTWKKKPLISLLYFWDRPLPGNKEELFSQSFLSLKDQVYSRWELLLICSRDKPEEGFLQALAKESFCKIKPLFFGDQEQGQLPGILPRHCEGDWIGILSQGDVLDPRALHAFAQVIQEHPEDELIYSDEQGIDNNNQKKFFFKPSWSPTLLSHYPYLGKLWIARKDRFWAVFKDKDLYSFNIDQRKMVQLVSDPIHVTHIPFVLCSGKRREIRHAEEAEVSFPQDLSLTISIIMPTIIKREDVVERCFKSIFEKTTYPHFELLTLVNRYYLPDDDPKRRLLDRWPVRKIAVDFPYNWSRLNNLGKDLAHGQILLFLNDDVEVLSPSWLEAMLSHAVQEDVAAVGAKLYYPDMSIQHAGVYFTPLMIGGEHILRGYRDEENAERWLGEVDRECTAVTGACLMIKKSLFESLGGFDESIPVAFNDVDFCLRAWRKGLRNIFCARAKLIHYEGMSRAGIPEENDYKLLLKRWTGVFDKGDPYWNPNLLDYLPNWTMNPLAKGSLRGRKMM